MNQILAFLLQARAKGQMQLEPGARDLLQQETRTTAGDQQILACDRAGRFMVFRAGRHFPRGGRRRLCVRFREEWSLRMRIDSGVPSTRSSSAMNATAYSKRSSIRRSLVSRMGVVLPEGRGRDVVKGFLRL